MEALTAAATFMFYAAGIYVVASVVFVALLLVLFAAQNERERDR